MKRSTRMIPVALIVGILLSTAAVAIAAKSHAVSQKNKNFSTTEINIKVGEQIHFTNDDTVAHNVFSATKGQEFNSKVQAPGQSIDIPFQSEGTAEVRCAIHPNMKILVHVSK